ncbi:hypothetical protein K474DRAFT_1669674 [Panus rudis PR-1116 ss-1]|nr:hypothetical protein K474DRAFT_1669674 [Panus rudis PR-1116 ss-1]
MSVLTMSKNPDSTENWDDDFEFNPNNGSERMPTRRSTTSTQFNEDWDGEQQQSVKNTPLSRDRANTLKRDSSLLLWAEPGPSTPSKRTHAQAENWDDDFQDKTNSPQRQPRKAADSSSPRSHRSRKRSTIPEVENWDDEFEDKTGSPSGKSTRWESSSSSSSDGEFGFGDREDDRTVTSRNRRAALSPTFPGDTPPPPVPPIPTALLGSRHEPAPFPRSPTASVFSVPVSSTGGTESIGYSSTAHLALRPTVSGSSFGALPPSPPIHRERERRRLRKKSRPPRFDDNIYELDDRAENPPPLRPSTPEKSVSPPTNHAPLASEPPAPEPAPTPPSRSSLVSRIGSVGKKWGAARKKRVSTEPSEVALQEASQDTPRAPATSASPPSQSSRSGWFFRHGGGAAGSASPPAKTTSLPLKHEKSVDRLLAAVGIDPDSPSRRKGKSKHPTDSNENVTGSEEYETNVPVSSLLFGAPRRPTSMQVPPTSSSRPPSRKSRHASYGQPPPGRRTPRSRSSSNHRSASASVDDLGRSSDHHSESQHEGNRSFMGGMRRISLSGKHKRTRSTAPGTHPVHEDRERELPRQSTSTSATALPVLPPERGNDATPRPTARTRPSVERPSVEEILLPPIELQPPSPPRAKPLQPSKSEPITQLRSIDSMMSLKEGIMQASATLSSASAIDITSSSPTPSPSRVKPPGSPQQAASLGRSTVPHKDAANGNVPRRNSLGDLKIPARISQAQVGLRRDLTMVRDFAASVEQLKQLQSTYTSLVNEVQAILVSTAPPDPPTQTRALSPTLFGLPRPGSRARSNTNPQEASSHKQMLAAYNAIQSRYALSWECAELLIELGGGTPAQEPSTTAPSDCSTHVAAPPAIQSSGTPRPSRDRAITLAGDEPKPHITLPSLNTSSSTTPPLASPPNPSQWRASTGRHDLSQRQLLLLRELITTDSTLQFDDRIPEEEINRSWRWGDAMSSTVTLPSEESSQQGSASATGSIAPGRATPAKLKKRRSARLGMRGLRDMLKSLKKSYSESQAQQATSSRATARTPPPLAIPQSSTSVSASTDSSLNLPTSDSKNQRPQSMIQRRRAKTSTGPESMKSLREHHPNSPYGTTGHSVTHKSSPRRPSLASIFRLGQKHKAASSSGPPSGDNSNQASAHPSPHTPAYRELELSAEDVPRVGSSSSGHVSRETDETDDGWDQIDSASDLDIASRALFGPGMDGSSTVRGKKGKGKSPYALLQQTRRTPNASQSSIWGGGESPQKSSASHATQNSVQSPSSSHGPTSTYSRSIKLSNVEEHVENSSRDRQPRQVSTSSTRAKNRASGAPSPSPKRPPSRGSRRGVPTGSVRSAPPQTWLSQGRGNSPETQSSLLPANFPTTTGAGIALAMTPENIKPLLENAKEVHARCQECIGELRSLLQVKQAAD